MAKKDQLRTLRQGTVINTTSSKQEKSLLLALEEVVSSLQSTFPKLQFEYAKQLLLADAVSHCRQHFPSVEFTYLFPTSSMRPDGGILYLVDKDKVRYPILISEKKNQGTNDTRLIEGKLKQAKGNAIERLGKNLIGFKTYMANESIFPFICFGDGCDFDESSSILDRVVTMAEFGHLNQLNLHALYQSHFKRGSFYFRVEPWSKAEMVTLMKTIAEQSIFYYFSKYSKARFE